MRISIMQPAYLPWLGFFDLMSNCELFVVLDNVQYTKRDWRSRNRIRTQTGWMWLSVPVLTKGKRGQLISEARIDNTYHWQRDHLHSIEAWYKKAPCFNQYYPVFKNMYEKKWEYLLDLDMTFIRFFAKELCIKTPLKYASALSSNTASGNQRIIEICKATNAKELYDSAGAKAFIKKELFDEMGVKVIFQEYMQPQYLQVFKPFIPYLSVVDLLFNEGFRSREIIRWISEKNFLNSSQPCSKI